MPALTDFDFITIYLRFVINIKYYLAYIVLYSIMPSVVTTYHNKTIYISVFNSAE